MKYTLQIIKTCKDIDANDIRFVDEEGNVSGKGFISKKDKSIGLLLCPECLKENYALNVLSGCCTWCDFTINAHVKKD